jgi:hypothetical protein
VSLSRRVGRLVGRGGASTTGGIPPRRGASRRQGSAKREVAARSPLTERGRFEVAVVAILKDEAPNMEEWLCHHLAIGVDHFFLYDNGSTDDLHDVLRPYANHGLVTTVYFPLRGLQRDANNHAVRFFGATTEWLAYVDIDEFLVPENDEPISDVLGRFPDAEQVLVSRKEFCYGGHRTPPGGLVTESYREFSQDVPRVGTSAILAKPIIRPAGTIRVGIHNATTVHGRTVNTAGQPTSEEATAIEDPSYANLQMNHYFTKSWQEFQAKRQRATTSTHAFALPDVPFDIPAQPDRVIERWQPRTRQLMDEMRALAPSPSRYGSRLRLAGFPISDMFGQEATAIVTNEAAGLSEARKKRTARSLPMPGVRGAMARGEDHDYAPSVGALLASVHVAQELAWLSAEVTWAAPDGRPALRLEGATLDASGPVPHVRFADGRGSLVIPVGGAAWRCHALLFVLRVHGVADGAAVGAELAAQEAGAWQVAATFEMPGPGTYLGLVALEKRPRTITAARVALSGLDEMDVYDLALLTFG